MHLCIHFVFSALGVRLNMDIKVHNLPLDLKIILVLFVCTVATLYVSPMKGNMK